MATFGLQKRPASEMQRGKEPQLGQERPVVEHIASDEKMKDDTTTTETTTVATHAEQINEQLGTVVELSEAESVVVTEEDALEIVEAIAKSIAATNRMEMASSVAATGGSSIDSNRSKLDEWAEHETLKGKSCTKAEVEFADLVAGDDVSMTQLIETAETLACSDTATGGRSVDAHSVISLDEIGEPKRDTGEAKEEKASGERQLVDSSVEEETAKTKGTSDVNVMPARLDPITTAPDTEVSEPESESEKSPLKFAVHGTDAAAKRALTTPSPVHSIVCHLQDHKKDASLPTHRTPSATNLALSGSSPVKQVVQRLETHDEDNALERLKIRTKRDFFTEDQRSVSVRAERERFQAQIAKEGAKATERLNSPVKNPTRQSAAMSSVRNMASRFETRAAQSLDQLSFRTVRSFFPKEKGLHVDDEKQKLEAFEKKQVASDEQMGKKAEERHGVGEAGCQDAVLEPGSRRYTVSDDNSKVRGIASRFESKRAYSIVTAPVRTIDSFIVDDSQVSVRVAAEKAKFENKTTTSMPVTRTIDSFIVADSEASVRVAAEKAMFESQQKFFTPVKRTIDSFIVPESEASVRVSAETAKFETRDKQGKTTTRTIDTFIVPEAEASVRVSAEKERFESLEKQGRGPVIRTIDTFIVPESEMSIRVAVEKAKLEALEQQNQKELQEQAAIDLQKIEKAKLLAKEKMRLEAEDKIKEAEEIEKRDAEEKARVAAKAKAGMEAEEMARGKAEKTRLEAEEKVVKEKARWETEEMERVESKTGLEAEDKMKWEKREIFREETGRMEAEQMAKEEADVKARMEAEKRVKWEVEGKARYEVEAEAKARKGAEEKAAEEKTRLEAEERAKSIPEVKARLTELAESREGLLTDEAAITVRNDNGKEKANVSTLDEVETKEDAATSVHQQPIRSSSFVEVTVEHQTLADVVSTAQHTHWLSIPVNANPALARLHTVLTDNNPLTAYALYPSSSPTSLSSYATDDEE